VSSTGRDAEHQLYEPFLPEELRVEVVGCMSIAFFAMAAVLLLDLWARRIVQPHTPH
jgi:hypothetical protein